MKRRVIEAGPQRLGSLAVLSGLIVQYRRCRANEETMMTKFSGRNFRARAGHDTRCLVEPKSHERLCSLGYPLKRLLAFETPGVSECPRLAHGDLDCFAASLAD